MWTDAPQMLCFFGNSPQSFTNGVIADRRNATDGPDVSLPNQVRYPNGIGDFHELHFTKSKPSLFLAAMPRTIPLLGFRPALRDRDHEATPPSADVVADMHYDL